MTERMIPLPRVFGHHDKPNDVRYWVKPSLIAGIEPLDNKRAALWQQGKPALPEDEEKGLDGPACLVELAHCSVPALFVDLSAEEVLRMRDEAFGVARKDGENR